MNLENYGGDQKGLGFSQTLKNFNSDELVIPESFAKLEARESLQRTLRNVAIKCIKIETKIHHKKHKMDRIGLIQKLRGHKKDGASFPNQIQYKVSQIHGQIIL